MKKLFLQVFILSMLVCLTASFGVCAAEVTDFERIEDESEALLPYTSLLVGFEKDYYAPEDESTVTQLIAEAVRLHGIYNGSGIENSYDEEEYRQYALENGIIYDGLFEDYSRGATRAETVYCLYNAVPSEIFVPEICNIVSIPDCDPSAGYYQPLLAFYKAGIVSGYDKYGAFRPGAAIINKDFADILKKLTNASLRTFTEYEEYATDAAFYLIDDFIMSIAVRDLYNIASGWKYDYTGSRKKGVANAYKNVLEDTSGVDNISISRQIFPQHDGVLVFESIMTAAANTNTDGITITFDDSMGDDVFTLETENGGVYCYVSGGEGKSGVSQSITSLATDGKIRVRIELDLDNNNASCFVNGTPIGQYKLVEGYEDVAKVTIATGIEQATILTVEKVHLYKNYKVNDVMRVESIGTAPFGYTTTGNITVQTLSGSNSSSTGDINSAYIVAKANENANAHKDFDEVGGLVKLEAYMLLPEENDGAYFTASYKGYPVFKIETKNGKFYYGSRELYDYSANIWQNIHVEANTNTQTFLLRINGKLISDNLPFTNKVPAFDSLDIGITPSEDCKMWFDDVEVYEMFEHDDYVPVPQKLESDYYVSMSVCNLWRNGSHYGWEYIAPHDDVTPYTGYYDEGEPEAMDWEIKFLAEHGVSFYNMCWYAPACPQNNPIKKPRMVDAFHDGYFNSKYSDMLDFTIMFENASFKTAESYDSFVNNVWPFWIEWYLKDDRYFTIDDKPFLVIYQYANWIQMCYEEAVTDDMTAERKAEIHANAIVRAKELFDMMEQDMIEIGYSGLILTFTNTGHTKTIANECNAIGAAGVFPYNWGTTACDLTSHKNKVETSYKTATDNGIDLLAVAGIGFNHLGWKLVREPLMSNDDFNALLYWFRDDYMKRYETKYADDAENLWKSKFIQFATWNEYGEGHYLYPSNLNGYGYLDSIAEVFGKGEHDTSLDVMPTDEQKARIGHLYPGYRNYIRRTYHISPDTGFTIPDLVEKSYDFTQTNSIATLGLSFSGFSSKPQQVNSKREWNWDSFSYIYTYSGEIKGTSSSTDPMMSWKLAEPINAKDYEFIHIKLGATSACSGTMYFISDAITKFTEDYKLTFSIKSGTNDYYLPTSANPLWDGSITHLRIDPGSLLENEISFYCLELMNYSDESKGIVINVDGDEYRPVLYDEIISYDRNEIYIAPTEEDHFYRQLHIVYDWNIKTQKLRLDTPDGTVIDLEIGSNIAYVDGVEKTLNKTVEIYDGCPVIPLLFILDNANYNYVYDSTKKRLNISSLDVSTVYLDLENGNAENEYVLDSFYNYLGGTNLVQRVTDPEDETNHVWLVEAGEGKSWSYIRTDAKLEAGKTYTVDFDFKLGTLKSGAAIDTSHNVTVNARYANTSQMETATGNHYDHTTSVGSISAADGWKHYSCTFTVADDYVTTDLDGKEYTDSICIFMNPVEVDSVWYGINYYVDNFVVRTAIDPVKLYNGDAESDDFTGISPTKYISIETETLDDGTQNRYWKVVPSSTEAASWAYWNQDTEFVPGATYYYEVDVRLGQNAAGEDVKTSVCLNARYYDVLQAHLKSNPQEHSFGLGSFESGGDWKRVQGSFNITDGYKSYAESKYQPKISFYANPSRTAPDGSETSYVGVEYHIDNFKIYSVKPDHFE